MAKPGAGEVVVIPFPQTDLTVGKRATSTCDIDLPGQDVILCQITSRARSDNLIGCARAAMTLTAAS